MLMEMKLKILMYIFKNFNVLIIGLYKQTVPDVTWQVCECHILSQPLTTLQNTSSL